MPEAEPASLARFFKTRDSDTIIEGLGSLLAIQSKRVEQGLIHEEAAGELDPEVTRIVNGLFVNGVKLAKLVNPALAAASASKIAVQINQGVQAPTANALMASIIAEFEQRGIGRADITPEMVHGMLAAGSSVIDVESVA